MHIILNSHSSDENFNGDCDYAIVTKPLATGPITSNKQNTPSYPLVTTSMPMKPSERSMIES